MKIRVEGRYLGGVVVLAPEVFEDERGFFMEVYRRDQFSELGISQEFVQDNHSRSLKGVLRGLHFQWDPPMGKLMRVVRGSAFLVAVDIRINSPTLGRWYGIEVSESDKKMVWAPAGFARGFCGLTEAVEIQYKCTGTYNSAAESGIRWNDPALGIHWPIHDPVVSDRDRKAQTLAEWLARPEARHFLF